MNNPNLKFFGGVGHTTGANIMLEFNQTKILVDCGLLQGTRDAEEKNFEKFKYDPASVDFLLVTHAHLDHVGKIPKLIREGFKGKIISTKETMELAELILLDAIKVMRTKHHNKILFDEKDLEKAMSFWQGFDYGEEVELWKPTLPVGSGCFLKMQNAGHILGSSILNVTCVENPPSQRSGAARKIKIAFTGDLGNSPSPLLPDAEFLEDTDYVVMESVYGDRNHESKSERKEKLKEYILESIKKGGAIVIPAFSVERVQVLLYEINNMIEDKEIPEIPVFLDSPLAIKVTNIYKKYKKDFKTSVQSEIEAGDDIFDFPGLHIIGRASESVEIEKTAGAKIILAGSGMSEGGRVVNHEAHFLPDPKATIILAGYQSVGTLGRLLQDGAKEVFIDTDGNRSNGKEKVIVRAKIETIKGYSSHKDSEHLIEFVEKANESRKLTKVFVIMGEPKSSLFLCQRLRDYIGVNAVYPEEGRAYNLA